MGGATCWSVGFGTMQFSIRGYQPDDYSACRALWEELTEHHRRIYDSPRIGADDPGSGFDEYLENAALAMSWVGTENGDIVAFTGLLVEGSEGEVEPVIVTEDRRGHGIGRLMVEHVIAKATARGLSQLTIRPVARNIDAVRAFHRYGFRALGHIEMFMDLGPKPAEWRDGIEIHDLPFQY